MLIFFLIEKMHCFPNFGTLGTYSNRRLFDTYLYTFYFLNYAHQRAAKKFICE